MHNNADPIIILISQMKILRLRDITLRDLCRMTKLIHSRARVHAMFCTISKPFLKSMTQGAQIPGQLQKEDKLPPCHSSLHPSQSKMNQFDKEAKSPVAGEEDTGIQHPRKAYTQLYNTLSFLHICLPLKLCFPTANSILKTSKMSLAKLGCFKVFLLPFATVQ